MKKHIYTIAKSFLIILGINALQPALSQNDRSSLDIIEKDFTSTDNVHISCSPLINGSQRFYITLISEEVSEVISTNKSLASTEHQPLKGFTLQSPNPNETTCEDIRALYSQVVTEQNSDDIEMTINQKLSEYSFSAHGSFYRGLQERFVIKLGRHMEFSITGQLKLEQRDAP